jgi:tRNA pseudouridine38-40 synthase
MGLEGRPVRRIAVGIEYDGTGFHGWQLQTQVCSIQQEVQRALGTIADGPVALTCAGRTDAGVHARAQVAHFDTVAERSMRAWVLGANCELPSAINLRWACSVPQHFHARFGALRRSYRYLILNRPVRSGLAAQRAWCVFHPLDQAAMQAAAAHLLGEHDFSGFRAAECQAHTPVRTIESLRVWRTGEWLRIEVTANAFLQHMVRNIAGLLVEVGRGDAPPTRALEQLESRQRQLGAATAPAHGLYFWRVEYPTEFGLPDDSAMIDVPEALSL